MLKPARGVRKRHASVSAETVAPAVVDRMVEAVIASFAHEIRTPLTGVLAVSDLLSRSGLSERERALVEILKNSAEHIVALSSLVIDGVRAREKGLVLQRDQFDLHVLARTLAATLDTRGRVKGLICSTRIADDLPVTMVGDRVRLRAAVENLIDNAVKFTADGEVSLDISYADGMVCFAVTDTGTGLRPQEIRRLFRPFVQGNDRVGERFGGAGLGLAFVRRVARAMGGDVTVSAIPGEGSTFRLAVTIVPPEPGQAAPRARRSKAKADALPASPARPRRDRGERPKLRILCAEDNTFGRVIIKTILSEFGHSVAFVGSGTGVIAAISGGHRYDMILMDIELAGLDGIEATRRIRELPGLAGQIPVIGFSGSTEKEAAARAAGMDGFLHKPVKPAKLAGALDFVIARLARGAADVNKTAATTSGDAVMQGKN